MKQIVMALMLVVATSSCVWAECRIYEYAEMKDMTDGELQVEINLTKNLSDIDMDLAEKMVNLGESRRYEKALASAKVCQEQNSRLMAVKSKRKISTDTKPSLSYEDCKKITEASHSDSKICDQYIKQ